MHNRVAIYARQSENIKEGIDRQIPRCEALARSRDWLVVDTYVDNDTSASKPRGPGTGWARMVSDLENNAVDTIIAVDIDRLLRDTRDLALLIDLGAKVVTVDGEIDLTTADGEFRATMLASIARFEVRRKSERQRRANADRAQRGKPNPGRRRYGYEIDGCSPREPEASIVRGIFEDVIARRSVRSIAMGLTNSGVDPGTAKAWTPMRVREIATNPHYFGVMRHRGGEHQSEHITPIVSKSLGEEARAVLSDPDRRTSPGPSPRHLLSHVASCGTCSGRMVHMRGYICTAVPLRGHAQIAKHDLEKRAIDAVALAFLTTGAGLLPTAERAAMAELAVRRQGNERAQESLLADRDEGLVSASVVRARLVALRDERVSLDAELDRVRASAGVLQPLLAVGRELLGQDLEVLPMSSVWEAHEVAAARFRELPIEVQRASVRALINVTVLPYYVRDADGRKRRRPGERVFIEHKVATHLNPRVEIDPHEGESRGPSAEGGRRIAARRR